MHHDCDEQDLFYNDDEESDDDDDDQRCWNDDGCGTLSDDGPIFIDHQSTS